jgi:hypothetical protein
MIRVPGGEMMDEVIDCARMVEKCKTCGGPMDWEDGWYGCAACRDKAEEKVGTVE